MATRKCDYCGAEGTAPHVRGAKSAAVSIGNYREAACIDVRICDRCADEVMRDALRAVLERLGASEVDR